MQQQMINPQQQQQMVINPQQQQMGINQLGNEPPNDLRNLLATGNQQQKIGMPQQQQGWRIELICLNIFK